VVSTLAKGIVNWFDDKKGNGFITKEDGGGLWFEPDIVDKGGHRKPIRACLTAGQRQ